MRSVPLVICALGALLSGCASTQPMVQAQSASNDAALFYFIRVDYPPTAWTGQLVVNGKVVADLKDDACVRANVPVGKAEVGLKFPPMLGISDETFAVDAKPNETRYLLMTGDVKTTGLGLNTIYLRATFRVAELPAQGSDAKVEGLKQKCL